jgi:DNA-binding transcriptional LysR family regulator
MTIELRPLRQLLTLVELGSFGRAAAALQLSQPTLSRSIQALERQLGTELVLRTSTGVVPTDFGQVLMQRARGLLQLADELDRDVLRANALQAGHVGVGAGPYPAETIFVTALTRFVVAHPQVKVRLHVRAWDELLVRLRSREIDFFVAEISTLQREADLEIEALSEHPLHFVARSGHLLAGRTRVSVRDAVAYPMVTMSRVPPRILEPMLAAQRRSSQPGTAARPFPAVENATLAAVKHMVAGSDVISAVPVACVRDELERGTMVLLGSEPWLRLSYGVVKLKGQALGPAAARLREYLVEAEARLTIEESSLPARRVKRTGVGGRATRRRAVASAVRRG